MSCINTESQRRARAHVSWHLKRRHRFARTEHLARTSLYSPACAYASAPCSAIILAWSARCWRETRPCLFCVYARRVYSGMRTSTAQRVVAAAASRDHAIRRRTDRQPIGWSGFAFSETAVLRAQARMCVQFCWVLENLRNEHICVTVAPTVAILIMLFMI